MTTAIAPAPRVPSFGDLRNWPGRFSPKQTSRARVVVFLGMVLLAYHYSLLSLVQSLGLETPLAYVGLAPVIALILAGLRSRTARPGPAIHDRQVDYIVGVPLLAAALAINLVFPHHLSTMFWVWRIDLFSMPFFVAGAACVLFGIRAMWQQRLAISYLFLAWPLPYTVLLLGFLNGFTNITLAGLKTAVHLVPVASAVPVADGSLFQIMHAGHSFQISVVSACSGVNGMVGFLLVGTAFGVIVRGARIRKALWLSGGLFLLWLLNLVRILFIFWAGQQWGSSVAIGFFHPFVGLLSFNVGIVLMLLALKPFRLSIDGRLWGDADHDPPGTGNAGDGPPPVTASRKAIAVPRTGVALTILVALACSLSVLNSHLQTYDVVANALGTPRLASFSQYPATPDGWRAEQSDQFDWAKPYFGASSTWLRYTMFPGAATDLALQSTQAVTADVISTSDLNTFSAYGVEACYRFHGYKLRDIASVSLGGGVTGQTLSFYSSKQQQDWVVVYWIWPVRTATTTRYERVTLYIQDSAQTKFTAKLAGGQTDQGGLSSVDPVTRKLPALRSFLTDFARQVVHNQTAIRVGTTLPGASLVVNSNAKTPSAGAAVASAPSGVTSPGFTSAAKAVANYPWLHIRAKAPPKSPAPAAVTGSK